MKYDWDGTHAAAINAKREKSQRVLTTSEVLADHFKRNLDKKIYECCPLNR